MIIDMLCEPMDSYPTTEAMRTYLAKFVLFDETDADILINLHKYGTYSYWVETNIGSYWSTLIKNINTTSPIQYISSIATVMQGIIDENIVPNLALYKYINEN